MKKYAAALLCVFLVCGCSNITPNNEKVEVSQEKLENMTALYTGFAEANETIDNKSKIGVWAYYEDGTKEFITEGWTVKDPVTLKAGKTSEVTVEYRGLESTIMVECSEVDEASFKAESQSPDQSDLEVTHSKWYGKKLTYTGKIIARVDDKDFRGYMINIFDDKSYVCVLDYNKEFDFKEGQTVTFWAYGLGRVETKGLFGKERSCIAFKAKYKGKGIPFTAVLPGGPLPSGLLQNPYLYVGVKIVLKNETVLAIYVSKEKTMVNTDQYIQDRKIAKKIEEVIKNVCEIS